jgi:hypothetical protein
VSLYIRMVRFSKNSLFGQLRNQPPNLGYWLFLKHLSNLGQREWVAKDGSDSMCRSNMAVWCAVCQLSHHFSRNLTQVDKLASLLCQIVNTVQACQYSTSLSIQYKLVSASGYCNFIIGWMELGSCNLC